MDKRESLQALLILSFSFFSLAHVSHGQEIDFELAPYAVEVTRLDPEWGDFSSAQVIEPDSMGDVADNVEKFAGVYYNNPVGYAGNTELIVRGGEANFTKVQMEGIDVNNPTDSRGGGFAYATMAGLPIANMEMIKGSMSSISGSGAVSGVLSMNLGYADPTSFISAKVGAYGFRHYTGLTTLDLPSVQTQFAVSQIEEDSRYEGHRFESKGGFLKTSFAPSVDRQLSVSVWSTTTEQVRLPEDSGGLRYAVSSALDTVENDATGVSLKYRQIFQNSSQLSITAGHYSNDVVSVSPGVAGGERNPFGVPANRFDDRFKRRQIETSYRFAGESPLHLALGLRIEKEDAESESIVDLFPGFSLPSSYDVSRNKQSGFVETGYELMEGHYLHFSGRYDEVSDLDGRWSSGAKYGLRLPTIHGEMYVGYHEAYKAPSLFALNNALVGNSDLKSETSKTCEIGLTGMEISNRFRWRIAAYSQRYEDLIDLSETTQNLINLSSVDIHGFEASLTAQVTSYFQLEAVLSFLSIDLQDEGELLRHRPEQQLRTSFIWEPNHQHQIRLSYGYTGTRWDSSIPTGNIKLEEDHDLALSWTGSFGETWKVSVELQNLLQQDNQVLIGYEKRGTSALLSVAWFWDAK